MEIRPQKLQLVRTIRTPLGPHEILSLLGAGGMGEVYRARDTKLSREVALRVLPEAFAADVVLSYSWRIRKSQITLGKTGIRWQAASR